MRITSALTAISLLAFTAICSASDSDDAVEKNLRVQISQSPELAPSEHHVHIHVHRGVVTLDGHVQTDSQRQAIETLARNTPGVVAVKDQLRSKVAEPSETPVPVYTKAPPVVRSVQPEVIEPVPVMVPQYPKLKVQAATEEDRAPAEAIADELQDESVPATQMQDVTILVRNGSASLRGVVDNREEHDLILSAVQRAGTVTAIYDELRIR